MAVPLENITTVSTLKKDEEENNNSNKKIFSNIKENINPELDTSLKGDKKSANSDKKNNDKKINKKLMRSNSSIIKPVTNIFDIIKDNDNDIIQENKINIFHFSKAKTLVANNAKNKKNINTYLNYKEGHLETVIEAISEASNSRNESKNNEIKKKLNSTGSPIINKRKLNN